MLIGNDSSFARGERGADDGAFCVDHRNVGGVTTTGSTSTLDGMSVIELQTLSGNGCDVCNLLRREAGE